MRCGYARCGPRPPRSPCSACTPRTRSPPPRASRTRPARVLTHRRVGCALTRRPRLGGAGDCDVVRARDGSAPRLLRPPVGRQREFRLRAVAGGAGGGGGEAEGWRRRRRREAGRRDGVRTGFAKRRRHASPVPVLPPRGAGGGVCRLRVSRVEVSAARGAKQHTTSGERAASRARSRRRCCPPEKWCSTGRALWRRAAAAAARVAHAERAASRALTRPDR